MNDTSELWNDSAHNGLSFLEDSNTTARNPSSVDSNNNNNNNNNMDANAWLEEAEAMGRPTETISPVDEFQLTHPNSNADISALLTAWKNERNCPDILPFQFDLVNDLLEMVETQSQLLREQSMGSTTETFLPLQYLMMELERVRYLLKSYLVARLIKIQKYARHLQKEPERLELLALPEVEFVKDFAELEESHSVTSSLEILPEALRAADDDKMIISPNGSYPVFIRPKEDLGEVLLEEE